jgi:hypothetical protein
LKNIVEIIGYHGTDAKNKASILKSGFELSEGLENEQWLGDGAYFFCEGVDEPISFAENWAKVESWDNSSHTFKYTRYCVLKTIIKVDEENFLDLTTKEGLEVFNYLRKKYVETLYKGKKRVNDFGFKDGYLINDAVSQGLIKANVIKGNFFIKLTKEERVSKVQFKTPNCTIMSIRNSSCITLVELVKENVI